MNSEFNNALQSNFYSLKNAKSKFGWYKCVYTYAIGGLAGTVWETFLNLARGNGFVYCSGCILTPFNFVYGVGAVVVICCLRNRTKPTEVFIIGSLGGGIVEYVLSFLEETILGTHSWDYSQRLLNINGRTTLPYMIGWGLLCVAVIFLVYNPFNSALDCLPEKVAKIGAIVIAAVILADFAVTLGALVRYACRNGGIEAFTFIGRFIDGIFTDEFMQLRFPNMHFT
ncbi:MAG: putative ABC transporter permease [Clostridia bacterium]|nr:putative ABC transporter permease [Clostridia bacterium]